MEVIATETTIAMDGGEARTIEVVRERGAHVPFVIMFMDVFGVRPALVALAGQIARMGFRVLLPDLYWRRGPLDAPDLNDLFADKENLRSVIENLKASTSPEAVIKDTGRILDWISSRSEAGTKTGVVGYCMGGGPALRVAAQFPEKIAAAASFHGGHLVTEAADSPHLGARHIKGEVFVAGADHDPGFTVEEKERLEKACTEAGTNAAVTIYKGAKHGFAIPDHPAYEVKADARHRSDLSELMLRTLR